MERKKVIETIEKLQGAPYHYTKKDIVDLLIKSNNAVERGIVAIYKRQTEAEQVTEETRDKNYVGFSAFHAKRGTYYADWIMKGKHLSNGHLERGRILILHYAEQLAKIANKEI